MAISGPPGCYGVPFGFILEAHRTGNVHTSGFAFLWEPAGRLSFPNVGGGVIECKPGANSANVGHIPQDADH